MEDSRYDEKGPLKPSALSFARLQKNAKWTWVKGGYSDVTRTSNNTVVKVTDNSTPAQYVRRVFDRKTPSGRLR